jgi:hypothetical protein
MENRLEEGLSNINSSYVVGYIDFAEIYHCSVRDVDRRTAELVSR